MCDLIANYGYECFNTPKTKDREYLYVAFDGQYYFTTTYNSDNDNYYSTYIYYIYSFLHIFKQNLKPNLEFY